MNQTSIAYKMESKYVGERELYLEIYTPKNAEDSKRQVTLLFLHGAFTGSWMWKKYIPHFVEEGYTCHVMNLRGHYKSRACDLTVTTFDDYLEDIEVFLEHCSKPVVLIGFSMGGLLGQKIAEKYTLAGLVLIDSSLNAALHELVGHEDCNLALMASIVPAPVRDETYSVDETEEDIVYQRQYLTMESGHAINACRGWRISDRIVIEPAKVICPVLVIKAENTKQDLLIGQTMANQFGGQYFGQQNATHTGLLVGQRYQPNVEILLAWINKKVVGHG